MSVEVVGLPHVRASMFETPSFWEGWVFGSQDAWYHVPTLLSADMMNIFY